MIRFGLDRLLADPALRRPLAGKRVALLAHPASLTRELTHSLDALAALPDLRLTAAFGPQHGLRGDKQDNMMESPDFIDPALGIPVFSLYGEVRRPTDAMMASFDVLLVDLQDLGCRLGQGYLLARPMPVADFGQWLGTAANTLRASLPA